MPASTYAEFYMHPFLLVPESRAAGRKVYEDRVYIEIKIKGDANTSFSRPKREQDEKDFAAEWKEYTTGEMEIEGTPLRSLPNISPAKEKNLSAAGIRSIEELATLNDAVVIGVQGMVTLRKQAQAYLAALEEEPEPPKKKRRKRNKETGELE